MRTRSILATATAAAALLTAGMVPAASATPVSTGQSAAAAAPTVSPSADYFHISGTSYTCPTGNLCARVWDPTVSKYKVFKFYNCNTYSLSNWEGTGGYANRQTGSRATATFYGQSGNVLKNVPVGGSQTSYSWSPVWKIRNCY
ncbi:hypothetical protein PV963_14725 [Streptomyces coeruleorubidus]|uniref:hypothetical protein n=1 Tax=Streptomyces coeruleorubidus TaxID=116188 RepID=UPI00237F4A6B|nr:hypothetical protein [Streptomyces coeruleorubidus]WDV51543.1 hypothetical protein PV963_14725 [Streptomyces coeruleorubidus]